ncbi:BMP family lipoprotein [Desulforhopalus sp. 52FAK]
MPVSGLGDQSFNDITYAGLVKARNDFDLRLMIGQCQIGSLSITTEMETLLEEGADIIVANGWEFVDPVKEYAKKYPEKIFILNDQPVTGFGNVVSTIFSQHDGAFLAGALAAMVTKKQSVGFVGGMDIPVIQSFYIGFKEGVEYIDDKITVTAKYLEGEGGNGTGFDDPALGHKVGHGLYNDGVDVIFSVAGLSGNGVIRAAAERKLFVIGVDADQDHMAKGYVLTSVMKRLDTAVYTVLSKVVDGKMTPGLHYFDLENEGVSLTPMLFSREVVTEEIRKQLNEVKEKIVNKEIIVTNYLNTPSQQSNN